MSADEGNRRGQDQGSRTGADQGNRTGARARILSSLRASIARRETIDHPGRFAGWRPSEPVGSPLDGFEAMFRAAGGTSVRLRTLAETSTWIVELARDHTSITVGTGVPEQVRPDLPIETPDRASLGLSFARGAVAESGTLLLDARDGRRAQLLAPSHVVLVRTETVHATLVDALVAMKGDLPSAVGLHSGPSKSADIGQVMVRGVHGPGEIVAVLLDEE